MHVCVCVQRGIDETRFAKSLKIAMALPPIHRPPCPVWTLAQSHEFVHDFVPGEGGLWSYGAAPRRLVTPS